MQYVEGSDLSEWVRQRGRPSEREARRILGQVAAALDAAHQRGLVHRDIKPGNILIEAESGRAFVADFGLTAALGTEEPEEGGRLTASSALLGTPVYMSPEQAASEDVSPASDLYSLGVVAYELLTGELPYQAQTALAWAAAHLRDVASPIRDRRADLSVEVARLVDRCLAKLPEDRPQARELADVMLPSLEAEIDWPPPGLRALQGRARALARVALATAAAGLIVLLALAFPPDMVGIEGNWWERFEGLSGVGESALGVRQERPDTGAGGLRFWQGVLLFGLAGFAAGIIALIVSSVRAVVRLAAGRRRGWRWDTLIDVAADPDGRNGLLISGTREFAALPPVCQSEALRARRVLAGAPLVAGLWVIATQSLWAISIALGIRVLGGAGAVVSPAFLLLVVLPALFALAVGANTGRREARLLRPLPRRRAYSATVKSAETGAGPEEVAAWYSSLPQGGESGTRSGGWLRLTGAAAWSTAAAVGLLAILALTEIVAAVWVAGRVVQRLGPETAELARTIDRIALEDPLGTARRVLQPYSTGRQRAAEGTTDLWARQLLGAAGESDRVAEYASSPAYPLVGQVGAPIAQAIARAQQTPSQDTVRLLEELADHPRTALFRRLALASRVDLLAAALERPIAEGESLAEMAQLAYPRLGEAGRANAWAAVLAAARGQYDTAAERLGENAAFAEHVFRVPVGFASRYATIMLQELALVPLAELEELRENREAAEELRAVAIQLRRALLAEAWSTRMAGLAANPAGSPRLWEALRDGRIPAGFRVDALDGAWRGHCANPQEILSGPSDARRSAIAGAVESLAGVPHAASLARFTERAWDRRLEAGSAYTTWYERAADRIGSGLLGRLEFCNRGT
jgi:hypothetical protein